MNFIKWLLELLFQEKEEEQSTDMKLVLTRKWKTKDSTIGELTIDGVFECYILEDTERETKIYGETAIPKGKYPILLSYSPRFKKTLPLLVGVPEYSGIRIHPGNTKKDTEGCLLPGTKRVKDAVQNSRVAFNHLFEKLQEAEKDHRRIEIEVR